MQHWMLYSTAGSEWGQLHHKKKKIKKKIFRYIEALVIWKFHENCLFLVERSVSEKCQAHHWMQNWMLYLTAGSEWGQLDNKKKKIKKKIFSLHHSSSHLKIPRTFPVFWLNKASHRNTKGTIGCRIESSIQPWGQNGASLTTKKKKNEKKDFFSIYQHHPVTVPRNIACFLVEPSVSQKCQAHHWMQNSMLYSTLGLEWGQLDNKRKKKEKKWFFRYITAVVAWKLHEHCLFYGWTKRLTEMPRAPLDAELNAQFNHGVRMRPAWLQKRKEMKKKTFSAFISTTRLQFPRTLPVFWLNKASHRNAKGTTGCKIECAIQPMGQNEASITTKKKKMKYKIFSAFIGTTRLQFPRTLPVFWLNKASHRNAKGTIGCRIECSIQPWGQNEASLTTKKKKNEKKILSLYHSSSNLKTPRTLPVLWLNEASDWNAKDTIGCRIECSIQPMGQNEASLTTKKKKKWKKAFFLYITAVVI